MGNVLSNSKLLVMDKKKFYSVLVDINCFIFIPNIVDNIICDPLGIIETWLTDIPVYIKKIN